METKTPIKFYKVNYCCDDCSIKPNPGCLLKFTGQVLTSSPPYYVHVCGICNKRYNLHKLYPCTEYEKIQEVNDE